MLTIGSLFSGIGGLELGLERAGLGPVLWQCEIDPYCRDVLERHWPKVMRFSDVSTPREWPAVDVICGGFPCQDVSSAGKGAGLEGARSGLWFAFRDVVAKVRPRFVVAENVASGKARWLPTVRGDLCDLDYRTRAYALSASNVGAPHRRARVFVVGELVDADKIGRGSRTPERSGDECEEESAVGRREVGDPGRRGLDARSLRSESAEGHNAVREPPRRDASVADPVSDRPQGSKRTGAAKRTTGRGGLLPDSDSGELRDGAERVPGGRAGELRGEGRAESVNDREDVADRDGDRRRGEPASRAHARGTFGDDDARRHRWPPGRGDAEGWRAYVAAGGPEPALRRGSHGLSSGLDDATDDADTATFREQLSGLGNAVVPQCAEVVGLIIREMMRSTA